ncbi:MAG TPA: two-component regulator propeller domain-containing protein, partial [Rectinemataceae bacterium]|nr:two-component regulator propeller domain-containing protein [Rectinemataceae bacterium]
MLRCFLASSIICVALFLPCKAWALEPGDVSWRTLGKEQGFWGGSVTCIIQDRRGLVWIGAAGGLYRYDGHSFAVFKPDPGRNSLLSSSISAVLEDKTGDLWVGTDGGGLARYKTLAGTFTSVALPADEAEAVASLRIAALAMDEEGRVIAGTAEGYVYRIDPSDNKVAVLSRPGLSHEPVTSLLVDSKGRLWAGTNGGGLLCWISEGAPASRYIHDNGRKDSISSDHVSAIIEDSLGFVWIGFSDSGIDLVEDGRFSHAKRDGERGGPLPAVLSLAEDIKGQIWAGFHDGGIGILDPSRMEATVSFFAGGAEVTTLVRDRRGLMWMGLDRGGLLTGDLRSTTFSRYPVSSEGKPLGAIQAIAETSLNGIVIASH